MAISEREFERDPTLRSMRTYDKVNPEVEGFESVDGPGTRFSGSAYWAPNEANGTVALALADLENNSYD